MPLYNSVKNKDFDRFEFQLKEKLELEFQKCLPTQHHSNMFENFTRARYEREQSKYELQILKQRVASNRLLESFHVPPIHPPPSTNGITDQNSRLYIMQQYEKVIQHIKSDMMFVYIMAAETKARECQTKYDIEKVKFRDNQHTGMEDDRLSKSMCDIIQRRVNNIDERIKTVHDLKARFFAIAPAVVTKKTM
ncbi:unnamed protein product [Didymodactylos carnosus]|uniref:Uncharacterized protein n=1 Tax=Didymodactylos carnosus TaxID=1234261 RepID=A0A814L5Q5_9BILA|nr:unnamed protein product [Didymodactylos carnosus]CAF1061520.1 unnamed protein product [Didymodactylos carnosus]CAF3599571.1 unnamed protein product [Didymodactylos carnosus]CAF3829778.1 unnamed protein product [Didymodactylos carnosus]